MSARKIIRGTVITPLRVKRPSIENEARVLEKLHSKGGHPNLISVLGHGELDCDHYFFDMEVCIMNLEHFIQGEIKSTLGLEQYLDPCFEITNPNHACLSFWVIVKQITSGLEFLHSLHELHRDLKPRNGGSLNSTR